MTQLNNHHNCTLLGRIHLVLCSAIKCSLFYLVLIYFLTQISEAPFHFITLMNFVPQLLECTSRTSRREIIATTTSTVTVHTVQHLNIVISQMCMFTGCRMSQVHSTYGLPHREEERVKHPAYILEAGLHILQPVLKSVYIDTHTHTRMWESLPRT